MTATTTLIERPPIVVVMGHVDHGKSTLLDFIRHSNTVEKEFGGITQHVAAYEVEHCSPTTSECKRITFIDTPGHAAFQAIRARGAAAADIAILVVAADDGVKAQTLEALESIKQAGIPFVVAINKIDKPNANVERVQGSLMEHGVYMERLGGDVPWVAISAKSGTGIDELLDLVLLVAEVGELKADASVQAQGYVVEAHRDSKRGIAATLIITDGTLKIGMAVLAADAIAPVRIMEDHRGTPIKTATFSTPVSLVGFDVLPAVGSVFTCFKNKKEAESARALEVSGRPEAETTTKISDTSDENTFVLPIIIRADTSGSLEAIAHEIVKFASEHSRVALVQSGIGDISENDIKTALASNPHALVVGFNVGIDRLAETLARERGVSFEFFNIIYKLSERLEETMRSRAPKRTIEEVVGRAKILKQFSSRKLEHLIGGTVLEGMIVKNGNVRITRHGSVLGIGVIISIQSNRQSASRVEAGSEFGAQIEAEFEMTENDMLECIVTKTI